MALNGIRIAGTNRGRERRAWRRRDKDRKKAFGDALRDKLEEESPPEEAEEAHELDPRDPTHMWWRGDKRIDFVV